MWLFFVQKCDCFTSCLKNLPEFKSRRFELTVFSEDCVTIVGQTEKEKDQAEQEKLQNVQLKEKRGTRK